MLGLGVYSGRVVSYFAAATTTWYLNRRITFVGYDDARPLRQWFRFVLTNGFGGLVNASYSMDTLVHNTIWIVGHCR